VTDHIDTIRRMITFSLIFDIESNRKKPLWGADI